MGEGERGRERGGRGKIYRRERVRGDGRGREGEREVGGER